MKIINKINKYLLEHYPLIWNTRLVWMIGANIILHLLFFALGFFSVSGLEDIKEHHNLEAFFMKESNVYYNFLLSIFIILIWIIFYLRNNAFKHTYRVKQYMLFQQFVIILFIILISITQYFSFEKGLRIRIKSLYDWEEIDRDIKAFNKSSLFLMQGQSSYEIKHKKYPAPFPLEVVESYNKNSISNIDTSKAYIKYGDRFLQFYQFDKVLWEKDTKGKLLYNYSANDFKYRIVKDVSSFKELIYPSLLNYSKEEFTYGQDSIAYQKQLKNHEDLLNNQDDIKIKEALATFLALSEKYKAEHNLSVDKWFTLIDNKPNYLLKELIGTSDPKADDLNSIKFNYKKRKKASEINIPFSKELYFSYNQIDDFFNNVYEAYYPKSDIALFNILLVVSFILSILILIFKTTNLKTLLLSFVASLVVMVLITWLMSSSKSILRNSISRDSVIMIFVSLLVIILSLFSYVLKWKKLLVAIFWSLCIFAIPSFFLFSSLYYSEYLKEKHKKEFPKDLDFVSGFEIWFDNFGFWSIMFIWLTTVLLYSFYGRKLKARSM